MNFKEWSKTAESEYTCEFGRYGIRDIYTTPFGVKVHDEVFMPRSIFQPQSQQTLVDLQYPVSKREWLKSKGADLDEYRYTEEGWGYPLFRGENSLERAYKFIEEEN